MQKVRCHLQKMRLQQLCKLYVSVSFQQNPYGLLFHHSLTVLYTIDHSWYLGLVGGSTIFKQGLPSPLYSIKGKKIGYTGLKPSLAEALKPIKALYTNILTN